MFNVLPGQGLGFSGSKEIAFGLGPVVVTEVPLETTSSFGFIYRSKAKVYDNAYSKRNDEVELLELLTILSQVM